MKSDLPLNIRIDIHNASSDDVYMADIWPDSSTNIKVRDDNIAGLMQAIGRAVTRWVEEWEVKP